MDFVQAPALEPGVPPGGACPCPHPAPPPASAVSRFLPPAASPLFNLVDSDRVRCCRVATQLMSDIEILLDGEVDVTDEQHVGITFKH
jgi:hypothetical protein